MSESSPEDIVNDLLSDIPGSRPCKVERNRPLVAALKHFLKLKKKGDTSASLEWFYEAKLKEKFKGPSMSTVRRWVRQQ